MRFIFHIFLSALLFISCDAGKMGGYSSSTNYTSNNSIDGSNYNGKKYAVRYDIRTMYDGKKLFRIEALKNIKLISGQLVTKGTIGGWVNGPKNLSQQGNSWIADDAMVYEKATVLGNALIKGNAKIFGEAEINENAVIFDNAQVYDRAVVFGDAKVSDDARIYGSASISDNAVIFNSVTVHDEAIVHENARVYGSADIYDYARIHGSAIISGSTIVRGVASLGTGKRITRGDISGYR